VGEFGFIYAFILSPGEATVNDISSSVRIEESRRSRRSGGAVMI
jgi:hypothetical protein